MLRKVFCVLAVVFGLAMCLPAAQVKMLTKAESKGVVNGENKWWEVKYHQDEKNANSSNAVAIRLKIKLVEGSTTQLTGILWLYRSTTTNSSGDTIYDPASKDVIGNLQGQINTNPGDNDIRKLQRFTLTGSYTNSSMQHRAVSVMGFHYTGRHKGKSGDKRRGDDQLVVRIKEKAFFSAQTMSLTDCDQQPPDEDVLTEEDVNDTTPPDPDYGGE